MTHIDDLKAVRDAAYASYEMLHELVCAHVKEFDVLTMFDWDEAIKSSPFYVTYVAAKSNYHSLDVMYLSHLEYK